MARRPTIDHDAVFEARSQGHPVDYLAYLYWQRSRLTRKGGIEEMIVPVREAVLGLGREELYGTKHYATVVQTPEGPDVEVHDMPVLSRVEESLRTADLLVFDVATTGPDFRNGDRILTLGILEARMLGPVAFPPEGGQPFIPAADERIRIVPTHDLRFDSGGRPSTPEALSVHRLRDEDGDKFLPFAMHARRLHGLLSATAHRPIVAHNAPLDIGFLNAEFERCGLSPIRSPVIDTRAVSKRVWPTESGSLDAMASRLGQTHAKGIGRGGNTALADAILLARCLVRLAWAVQDKRMEEAAEEYESIRLARKRPARARK